MDDAALHEATVPVLRHYVARVDALLARLGAEHEAALRGRLAPDAFSAAGHLDCALGFALRTLGPLLGREPPEPDGGATDRIALRRRCRLVLETLDAVTPEDFAGAAGRIVRHTAGEATLAQSATAYATLFALPNFLFHVATALAVLRRAGLDVGKADFDGLHAYAAGFRFPADDTDVAAPR